MRILIAIALGGAGLLASVVAMANTGQAPTEAATAKAPPAATARIPAAGGEIAPAAAPASPPAAAPVAPLAIPGTEAAATETAPAAPAKPKPVAPTVVANINLTTQKMTVSVHGKVIHTWAVSSGLPAYPTPRGSFTATWMSKMHYSKQYDDAPMPHSVFFKNGAAIHGTNATRALGRPASHGCVRLAPGNAATFFNLVSRHGLTSTRVVVHGNLPAARVASRARPRSDDDGYSDRSSRRSERRANRDRRENRWPGDSYAWSGGNRGPYWSRY